MAHAILVFHLLAHVQTTNINTYKYSLSRNASGLLNLAWGALNPQASKITLSELLNNLILVGIVAWICLFLLCKLPLSHYISLPHADSCNV